MEGSFLSAIILPFSLALIMAGIGLELKTSDFSTIFKTPKPVIIGFIAQMILLPLLGILVGIYLFDFKDLYIGAGFIIITLAPGGVTSNLMTLLAKGDLALSVSLTAIISAITPFWMPLAASIILSKLPESQAIELGFLSTFLKLFVITILPIGIGMFINAKRNAWSLVLRKPVKILSSIFLAFIIIALTLKNKAILVDNFETVGVASVLLVTLSFLCGYLVARLFKLSVAQVRTITFEVGLQNGTLALLITASIIKIPAMSLASLFYSLLMFIAGFIVIFLFNRGDKKAETPKEN